MNRFAPPEEPALGAPAWVLPYGDMMSLLLACFLMLLSMSEVKEDHRFRATADSLRQQFGDRAAPARPVAGFGRQAHAGDFPVAGAGRAQREEAINRGNLVRLVGGGRYGDSTPPNTRHDWAGRNIRF